MYFIKKDLIIVGGGSAGIAAAISAFENGIKDLLILEKEKKLFMRYIKQFYKLNFELFYPSILISANTSSKYI